MNSNLMHLNLGQNKKVESRKGVPLIGYVWLLLSILSSSSILPVFYIYQNNRNTYLKYT
jgi:hypothetical protein